MKTIPSNLAAHILNDVTTLATIWLVTRTDNTKLGFTDHVDEIFISGVAYEPQSGFTRSAITTDQQLSVDNLDVEGILDSDQIVAADVRAGKYDYAEIIVSMVNYNDPTGGQLVLRKGKFGTITVKEDVFVAEIRGLTQNYSQNIIEVTQPKCRYDLFDSRCKLPRAGLEDPATVTSIITPRREFTFAAAPRDTTHYDFGLVRWTTGENAGLSMEVKLHLEPEHSIKLFLPMPGIIAMGDAMIIEAGCNLTFEGHCIGKFNNGINFGGEPHLPGNDLILQTPAFKES